MELDDEDPEPVDYEMFCRANSPDESVLVSHAVQLLDSRTTGKYVQYPQVSTEVYSEAEKLTEDPVVRISQRGQPDTPTLS